MNTKDLQAKYPSLFPDRPPQCGPGWYSLLDALCTVLYDREKAGGQRVVLLQAKEKFGRLTVRPYPFTEPDYSLVAYVAAVSQSVCEVCSAPGKLIDGSRTRCEVHEEVRPDWSPSTA